MKWKTVRTWRKELPQTWSDFKKHVSLSSSCHVVEAILNEVKTQTRPGTDAIIEGQIGAEYIKNKGKETSNIQRQQQGQATTPKQQQWQSNKNNFINHNSSYLIKPPPNKKNCKDSGD